METFAIQEEGEIGLDDFPPSSLLLLLPVMYTVVGQYLFTQPVSGREAEVEKGLPSDVVRENARRQTEQSGGGHVERAQTTLMGRPPPRDGPCGRQQLCQVQPQLPPNSA